MQIKTENKWITLPYKMVNELDATNDPKKISLIISKYESELAREILGGDEEYIWCDHGAEILSALLRWKHIKHKRAVGTTNDNKQSHSYVVLDDGTPLDPTNQGVGDRTQEKLYEAKFSSLTPFTKKETFKEYLGWGLFPFDSIYIIESLNTKLDNFKLISNNGIVTGIGSINENVFVKIELHSKTIESYNGFNIVFLVSYDSGKVYTESFQDNDMREVSKIVGGVVNATIDILNDYQWSFLTLIAKDYVSKRISLYNRVCSRVATKFKLDKISDEFNDNRVIILFDTKEIDGKLVWNHFLELNK